MTRQLINTLSKGLLKNYNKILQDKEFYTFALNLSPTDSITDRVTKVTENKLEEVLALNDTSYVILGLTWLGKEEYVYFILNTTTFTSEIWHVNKGVKTLKYNDSNLAFVPNKIISSTYRVDYKGDRLIYFVDGVNNDRVINIDKVQLTDSITTLDLVSYYGTTNTIDLSALSGGKLLQGNYVVAVSFVDEGNTETNIKALSNSINIGDGNYNENRYADYPGDSNLNYFRNNNSTFIEVKGLDNDEQTNKALKVSIRDDINESFDYMNIYIIRTTAETTSVKLLERVRVSSQVIITGSEKTIDVDEDISSIIISNILYNKSEVVFQKDNRLLRANTKIDSSSYDFQSLANTITVTYQTDEILANFGITADVVNDKRGDSKLVNDYLYTTVYQSSSPDYIANNNDKLNKTFSRDEVYALGVYFELEGGILTDVFHIPGRLPNPGIAGTNETEGIPTYAGASNASNFDTELLTYDGQSLPRWKIYNTAIKTSSNTGLLGYYRTNEVYPDGYNYPTDGEKNVQGKSYIRHHRIPSDILEPIITTTVSRDAESSIFNVYRRNLGLKFNLDLPEELALTVKKIYYTFSPKTNANKNVLGKGIIYAVDEVNNRQSNQLNRNAASNTDTQAYEFYSPESTFKFKASNISAKRLKTTALYNGVIRYISKTMNIYPPATSIYPHYPVWLNSEGAVLSGTGIGQTVDSYNYKQHVRFDNVFYNLRRTLINQDKKILPLNSIKFVDKNAVVNSNAESFNFAGNQNTVLVETKTATPYLGITFTEPSYNLPDGDRTSHLMVNYPTPWSFSDYNFQTALPKERFHDTVGFITLLSDNENIDSDLINLKYVTPYIKNNTLTGDSIIDVMHGKRGFSGLVNSNVQVYGRKASKEFIIGRIDNSAYIPDYEQHSDTMQYEDYFAFFTESQINFRMRSGTPDNDYYPNFTINSSILANTYEKQADKKENYFVDEGYNQYNIEEKFANNIKIEDLYIEQRRLGTRIVYSEVQNNESKVDNYRRTLANNYKDLITTRGPIYQMFMKQERLYALTRDSLFMINTSNQTLKTDSGYNISVGTGDFFAIEPTEVISIDGGSGGTSSKLSLNESPYGYLYVDKYKNQIMLFNDSLIDLNTLGLYEDFTLEMEKAFPELFTEQDCPQLNYGIACGYDNKLKRLFVTKLDYKPLDAFLVNYKGVYNENSTYISSDNYIKNGFLLNHGTKNPVNLSDDTLFENKSKTLTFDPITQTWISYHNYFPNRYIPNSNKTKVNIGKSINEFGNNYSDIQILEVLFNDEPNIDKVFDSVGLDVRSEDVNGNSTNDFFTEYIGYNEKQSTGLVEINDKTVTKKQTYWNINNFKDDSIDYSTKKLFVSDWTNIKNQYFIDKVVNPANISLNKEWYKRGRLRDKYLIVRFIRKNLDNKKIFCNFVKVNIRTSTR